jgi:hypothetical protein
MAAHPVDQGRDVKAPAHNPENVSVRRTITQAIIQEWMVGIAFSVSNDLRGAETSQQASRLQFHA